MSTSAPSIQSCWKEDSAYRRARYANHRESTQRQASLAYFERVRRNRDDRNRLIIDGSTELAKVVVIKASIDGNEPLLLTYARRAALVRNVSDPKVFAFIK